MFTNVIDILQKDGAALPDHIVDSVLNQDAFVLMADGVFSYFVNGFVKTHGYQPFYHGKEVVGTFQACPFFMFMSKP